jgi:hypothetical protein
MKNQIKKLLNLTDISYLKMVFNHYHQWCNYFSFGSLSDCQKLMANQALFSWWYDNYCYLQRQFIRRARKFSSACTGTLKDYHTEHVIKMKDVFSKKLMDDARKPKTVNPQLN